VIATELDVRYPIGKPDIPVVITNADLQSAVEDLADLPARLAEAIQGLDPAQLDTPYRQGGWTVRQLVHHIADSHMNAYVRVRLALTEEAPAVVDYDENAWAELHDSTTAPVESSLGILTGLHARWASMLNSLDSDQWLRTFVHPKRGPSTIQKATLLYSWHSRHHVAHITRMRERAGW
jgi:uncharacterized damage-inducible protein DinB